MMRYKRYVKILFIVLLPILILTLSLPYIDTNELKAEEVTLEEFDDSPSGNVKIVGMAENNIENQFFYFFDEQGSVYVKIERNIMTNDNSLLSCIGGGIKPIVINKLTKVESPDSTDQNRKFINDIDEIEIYKSKVILKNRKDGKFYVFGMNNGSAKLSIPTNTGLVKSDFIFRPVEIDTKDFMQGNLIDVLSGDNALLYLSDLGEIYAVGKDGVPKDLTSTITVTNPKTGEQETINKIQYRKETVGDGRDPVKAIIMTSSKHVYLWEKHSRKNIANIEKFTPVVTESGELFECQKDFHFKEYWGGLSTDFIFYQTENGMKKVYAPSTDIFHTNPDYGTTAGKYDPFASTIKYEEIESGKELYDRERTYSYINYLTPKQYSAQSWNEEFCDAIYNDNLIYYSTLPSAQKSFYMLSNGKLYVGTHEFSTPDDVDYVAPTWIEQTLTGIPNGYSNINEFLYNSGGSAPQFLITNSGAAFLNGVKINFYGDVSMSGKKVNDSNKSYASAEKYNDYVEVNIKKTEGIDRGKLYYKLDNDAEQEITSEFSETISVNEGEHIKKTYKGYIKSVDTNAVLSDSEMTFVVDLYKKDISVTGIENNKAYNSATITWDENNGIADNPITVTMTKDGSEYSYTKGAELNEQGSYTLTATDTYGNTKTYAFSILGPDDSLGLTFTKTSSGTLEYGNAITKANAQIGTISLIYGEDASTPGTIDLTSTSISAGNDDGYFSIDGDKLNVEKDLPAGTYTLTIDGTDSNGTSFSHTVEIVIAQKNVTLSLLVSEMTYGETVTIGADQVVGLPTGFTPSITLKSDVESMGSYENDEFTPDKAGTAVFTISATDPDGNYTFTGEDQNVIVKQKSVTLSLTQPITKYPGESLAKISPAANDNYTVTPELINGDTLNGTATYAYVSGSDQTGSGEKIKVKITGLSNDNYAITEAATELTVLDGDEIGDSWYTITGTKKTGFDWYSSDVSIVIDTSKSGKYDLISKDGDFTGATSSFVLNSDDTHDLSIQMKDSTSGRLTKPKDETIKIDRVIPIFTIDGNVGNQTVISGVETKGPVVLTVSLTSANASTVSYYYTTSSTDASSSPIDDASKWTLLTDGKLSASQEGTTTYYIKAVSGAGLISNVQEFTTVINNDVTTPSSITWTDGLSEQDLIYGDSLSLQISGLQNEEVSYSILDGVASSVTLNTNTRTLTANSGTGTIKVQAKIKGYKEPLVKTITLKKKDITVKTQVSNKDTIFVDLNGPLPQMSDFSITSSDFVGSDTISIISSVSYEYRNAKGDVITPTTNIKGTYKLYAKITTTLDNYTIKTIVPAIVDVGGDITYSNLTVKVESLKNGAYVPYQEGTWANKEIRFTLQGGIQDADKITGYEYIVSSTKPEMDDPNWISISNGGTMIHTVTQNSIDATYWFRVTPCAEGAKLSKQTTINLDHVSPDTPTVVIKEKPRNALEKALNAISFNAWFQQEVEVSFTSLDSDSGVKEITYEERTDTGTTSHTIPYGTSLTYDKDTALYLKAKAVDQAGNESSFSVEQPLAIDMSAPVIKGVQNQKEYKQYYVPRYVTVTDSSNGSQSASGLKLATYEKDNSPAGTFIDNVGKQIKGEGVYKIYAVDEAGNEVTLTFKIVKLPNIETEIDGSDESKEIIDQIIKELEEVKDHIDQNEKENYDKWIEDATDKWNDLRTKVVEDKETTSKVEGQGDTTFDPKTELIVEEIPKDQVPVLPKHAIKTYDVYLMKGNDPVQPDGSVKVYLPYGESEPPIVYEISENGSIKQLSVKQEEGYVTFVTTVLKKYAISNTAQSDTSGGNEPTPDDPSKNDQQCVVGPDGKLETADDVCAGGNGDHPPVKEPDGSITVPEGGVIIFPDKEVPAPDGAIIHPDGSVDFPDGSQLDPDGNEPNNPDPTPNPNPDDGKGDDKPNPNPNPDDDQDPDHNLPDINDPQDNICTTGPDGVSGTGDDVCGTPNEDGDKPIVNPDGSVTVPDGGSVIFPDGSEVELPDGGIIKPDGSVVLPDGTEYDPDGSKKDPEKPKRECNIKGTKINVDSDHDGLPDLNLDLDDDCVADINIDMDNDNIPDLNIDSIGDGNADINIDSNTDGIADVNMLKLTKWTPNFNTKVNGFAYDTMTGIKADLNIDVDGDGKPDVNIDSDGDGIADTNVIGGQSQGNKTDVVGGSNTADSTKWYIWLFMMLLTISTMIYSIYRKKRHS